MEKVLVIVDVQKDFDEFIQHDLVDGLNNYAKKFREVYQIWDTHKNNVAPSYKFPNEIGSYKKLFGVKHFSEEVKKFTDQMEDESYEGRTFKLSDNKGYVVRVDNNHDWFYVNPEIAELIGKLKNKKVILVGGADQECLEDVYQAFLAFGLDVQINKKYVYSAKTDSDDSIEDNINEGIGNKKYFNNITKKPTDYEYRFMTEDEFIKVYGDRWMRLVEYEWNHGMDHFLGNDFEIDGKNLIDFKNNNEFYIDDWTISSGMVIKNDPPQTPNYKPRKIKRTFESVNKYPYNQIIVVFDTINELKMYQEIYSKPYHNIPDGLIENSYEFFNRNSPVYLAYRMDDGDIIFEGWCDLPYLLRQTYSYMEGRTYEKLFKLRDVKNDLFKQILTKGRYDGIPSYKPKRIERTLENKILKLDEYLLESITDYETKKNRLLDICSQDHGYFMIYAEDKQNTLYIKKILEINNIKFDSNESEIDLSEIDDFFNNPDSFKKLCFTINIRYKSVYYILESYLKGTISRHTNLFVKIPEEEKILNEIGIIKTASFMYKPKKIERTLESNKNNYLYVVMGDKKNAHEFEKLLNSNNYIYFDKEETSNMVELYDETYVINDDDYKFFMFFISLTEKDYVVRIKMKNQLESELVYPNQKFEIMRELNISPTYSPKKINREL